ncbi:MAG: hypothetical protein AAF311_13925 [Pseudomonadota bacterium]
MRALPLVLSIGLLASASPASSEVVYDDYWGDNRCGGEVPCYCEWSPMRMTSFGYGFDADVQCHFVRPMSYQQNTGAFSGDATCFRFEDDETLTQWSESISFTISEDGQRLNLLTTGGGETYEESFTRCTSID